MHSQEFHTSTTCAIALSTTKQELYASCKVASYYNNTSAISQGVLAWRTKIPLGPTFWWKQCGVHVSNTTDCRSNYVFASSEKHMTICCLTHCAALLWGRLVGWACWHVKNKYVANQHGMVYTYLSYMNICIYIYIYICICICIYIYIYIYTCNCEIGHADADWIELNHGFGKIHKLTR